MNSVLWFIFTFVAVLGTIAFVWWLQRELVEQQRRARVQAEVARATASLRRLQHDAERQMRETVQSFIDVEGEER